MLQTYGQTGPEQNIYIQSVITTQKKLLYDYIIQIATGAFK